jgi:hypothetical protein
MHFVLKSLSDSFDATQEDEEAEKVLHGKLS